MNYNDINYYLITKLIYIDDKKEIRFFKIKVLCSDLYNNIN
jgi:hypothetical protein